MSPSKPAISPKQFMGMLLAHTYANDAHLQHSPGELRKSWEFVHPPYRKTSNNKWRNYLQGAWPKTGFYKKLVQFDSHLSGILENPLACVLEPDANEPSVWEERVGQVRVNEMSLFSFSNEFLDEFCRPPEWRKLFVLLALLRTDSNRYFMHRMWVQRNLTCFICLCAAASPLWELRREFFALLGLVKLKNGLLMDNVSGWFQSISDYEDAVIFIRILIDFIRAEYPHSISDLELANVVWRMALDTNVMKDWLSSDCSWESLNLSNKKISVWCRDVVRPVTVKGW